MSDETRSMAKPGQHWLIRVFAVVGLLGVLALILLVVAIYQIQGPYQPAKVAGAAPETVFTISDVQALDGTNFIRMDVAVSTGSGGSSPYSGRRDDTRNILLLDKVSGVSRKLLLDNDRKIGDARFLPARTDLQAANGADALTDQDDDREKAPPAYYALFVRQPDDGALIDLLVGTLSSGKQAYVMRGLDGIDSMWMQSPTQIGMIVRERLNLYHRVVDIPSLKVIQSKRIKID
jgi:hypothetical protein